MLKVSTIDYDAGRLLEQARNVNTQFGEDGIIGAILSQIASKVSWCVEFGAWDGKYLSNARNLIDRDHYRAVLIEGDPKSFAKLKDEFEHRPDVTCIEAFVGFEASNNLDSILSTTECPLDFDFLSIDIDGNDYHVWAATSRYRPRVVCIEFNPTIPTDVDFTQPPQMNIKWGCSLLALFRLALRKEYRFVCANRVNAFFVAQEHWTGAFAETESDLPRFRADAPESVYLFSGYDGTVLHSGDPSLAWHGIPIRDEDLQVLPVFLRKYPYDYGWLQKQAFRLFRRLRTL